MNLAMTDIKIKSSSADRQGNIPSLWDVKRLHYLFNMTIGLNITHDIVRNRMHLYWEGFRDIRVPCPPLAEQRTIAAHIASEDTRLETLHNTTERTITLLGERRSALIT
jgi:restriction endonuclease S subunit